MRTRPRDIRREHKFGPANLRDRVPAIIIAETLSQAKPQS